MNNTARIALILAALALTACKKTPEPEAAPAAPVATAPAPAPAAPAAADPAQMTDEQRALAEKTAALEFATMEDKFINDTRAQWANAAKASSTFGGAEASEQNMPKNVIGPLDSEEWTNNNIDIGFDTLEVGFAKPVQATELRLVSPNGDGVAAITKVELQDTDGKWNTIWSGVSDVKRDERGPRTWFVRTFDKTAYKAKGARYTFANNVEQGYKKADAVQLVGD